MENNTDKEQELSAAQVKVETPWFKLFLDEIGWREVIVVALVLMSVVYIVKG